jgi:bisanhydrobacterioruberin hydratase
MLPHTMHPRTQLALGATCITYLVGLVGLIHPATRPLFIQLTPVHLLYVLGLLLASHQRWTRAGAWVLLGIACAGFGIEWVGVHTALVFGHYHYGHGLGLQLDAVPLMIAANWLLMCYTATALAQRWLQHPLAVAAAAASLMVATDALLEPLAPRLDFWYWAQGAAPLQNYVAWWLCGAVLCMLLHRGIGRIVNAVSTPIYILQLLFFALLLWWM